MMKDQGAHFHKCDFQVHSPRDAAWSGPFDPVGQRREFAEALVADCRRKGLNAIAITDHHDLCLWKTVAASAATEKSASGNIFPTDERLIVFPGVELTLSTPPCQALLLFDPDLDEAILGHVWGALGVTPTPSSEPKTTQTLALQEELRLSEITARLEAIRTNPSETNPSNFEFLKRRFILLPNVKGGGHQTIVRHGFHTHFSGMPCVGGYIEGCLYSELDQVNRDKIEGKIERWGKTSLGVFQTSDCRKAVQSGQSGESLTDFSDLAKWPTWVKWAKPSAEALRQACLAHRSRIAHVEPEVPLLQIVGVKISDSLFLGPVELGLNPQFNAFIGGRGTGKSSLLEYVRWALGDDPIPQGDSSELPNFQRRRKTLIDDTLKPSHAIVTVFYRKNEVVYEIQRSTIDREEQVSVISTGSDPQRLALSQIRREFPIVSYAQKQLSCVGTLPEEITRLVTDPVKDAVAKLDDFINRDILPQLREQRSRDLRLRTLEIVIQESRRKAKSNREQIQALQSQLSTLTTEQQRVIDAHDGLAEQQQSIERIEEHPRRAFAILDAARKQLVALGNVAVNQTTPDYQRLAQVESEANAFVARAITDLSTLSEVVELDNWKTGTSKGIIVEVSEQYALHKSQYESFVKANAKNQQQFDEIQKLNKEIAGAETAIAAAEAERNTLKVRFDQVGNSQWELLMKTTKERGDFLAKQCSKITEQALHQFRADLRFCGDGRPVRDGLELVLQGRNVKDSDQKIKTLVSQVVDAANPIQIWADIVAELDFLIADKDATALPATPILASVLTHANLESIRAGTSPDSVEQVRFINIPDRIRFSFKMGRKPDGSDNFIPFESASPGQQATCLLGTLLAQSGAPLLIDQPEEDLDNEQIQVLSERLAQTKHNRQLLFVSHNANIVVNGDAELVACFGYRETSGNSRGIIDPIGSIDCKRVRHTITKVMEGGRSAFEMRRNKYGF